MNKNHEVNNNTERAQRKRKWLKRWRVVAFYLMCYDIIVANLAYLFALWIRFDCCYTQIPEEYLQSYFAFVPFYSVIVIVLHMWLRLYKSIWRFVSYDEFIHVTKASVLSSALHIMGTCVFIQRMPASYYLIGMGVQFMLTLAIRFSYRFVSLERRSQAVQNVAKKNVMLIGAGAAGQMILSELKYGRESRSKVCCIIDDNQNKWNRYIDGVLVVGGRDDILYNASKYKIDQILLAIPSADSREIRDILNICKETGCELKILPGIYQLVSGEVHVGQMRDVSVEDLLGREPIRVNLEEICGYLTDKVVLVTGGGGSIGSELCRQIASRNPKQLIIFDVYENNAYEIEQELKTKYKGQLDLVVLIGSVRDSRRINSVFEAYKPDVVYHAAAHKHVPLMETSPCESIKNNVMGTYKTACAALLNGCEKFVLISTDKAVNPTNIMGASKRLCEMIIQTLDKIGRSGKQYQLPTMYGHYEDGDRKYKGTRACKPLEKSTEFVAVRFGNVLGSNGSVIPLFQKQIQAGGPVTVTHPDIIRYFMTIPEAVSLVLQAGAYAHGGEIFVLDMGAPVKIDTLARNLIKLSGYKPDVDIPVVYTGLRPGEKLYEEKLMEEEGLTKTPNELIHIGKPIVFDEDKFLKQLVELANASYCNSENISDMVEEIVVTYHPLKNGQVERGEAYQNLVNQMKEKKE